MKCMIGSLRNHESREKVINLTVFDGVSIWKLIETRPYPFTVALLPMKWGSARPS